MQFFLIILRPFFTKKFSPTLLNLHEELSSIINVFCAAEDLDIANYNQAPMIEITYNWPNKDNKNEKLEVGRSFGHIAYRVKNIYQMCEKLMKEGVPINRPPRDGYMAFVKSPDNISIELLQDGEPLEPQEPWKSMPNIGEW